MATFTLDTSGVVNLGKAAFPFHNEYVEWPDLSPFVQGYVEALFADTGPLWRAATPLKVGVRASGFSDLDPSALALILRDCERWQHLYPNSPDGARFWELRNLQLIERPDFPPLQPYLSDEGRVCLREVRP